MVHVNHRLAGFSRLNRHAASVPHEIRPLTGFYCQANYLPGVNIDHAPALHFCLPRRVFCDVRAPQLGKPVYSEPAVQEIGCRDEVFTVHMSPLGSAKWSMPSPAGPGRAQRGSRDP